MGGKPWNCKPYVRRKSDVKKIIAIVLVICTLAGCMFLSPADISFAVQEDDNVIRAIEDSKAGIKSVKAGKQKLTAVFVKSTIEGAKYEVALKKAGSSKWLVSVTSATQKTWKNLSGGKKYSVRVRLKAVAGQAAYYGNWSDTVTKKVRHTTASRAEEIRKSMTMKEKVGQMFLSGAYTPSEAKTLVKKYHLGGVVLFKNSFTGRSKSSVKKMIADIQKQSKIKMLTAVDEEGGTVVRVSGNPGLRSTPFKSPRDTFAAGGWKHVKKEAKEKAQLLKSLGVNTNLAPVADLPKNSKSYIYKRAFSTDAKKTKKFVEIVVKEFEKQNEISTLKHFPGYAGNADSHSVVVYDKRKLKTLEKHDLIPFKAGIKTGAPMVMIKHTVLTSIDSKYPASLSLKIHKYLRDKMGFKGVILTDSLTMGAPQKWMGSNGKAAVQAVLAGNDIICTNSAKGEYEAVWKAVKKGKIKKSRIEESVQRILELKLSKGIIK